MRMMMRARATTLPAAAVLALWPASCSVGLWLWLLRPGHEMMRLMRKMRRRQPDQHGDVLLVLVLVQWQWQWPKMSLKKPANVPPLELPSPELPPRPPRQHVQVPPEPRLHPPLHDLHV
jgi:hypothetical protein